MRKEVKYSHMTTQKKNSKQMAIRLKVLLGTALMTAAAAAGPVSADPLIIRLTLPDGTVLGTSVEYETPYEELEASGILQRIYEGELGKVVAEAEQAALAAAEKTEEPAAYVPVEGYNVTWIGDSYSAMAEGIIEAYYPGVDLYAAYSKHTDMDADEGYGGASGISILNDIVSQGALRPYLVFALGTNDPIPSTEVYASYIDTVMALAGPDTTVVFVTPWTMNASWGEVSYQCEIDAMRSAPAWYPNAKVADWADYCQPYMEEFFTYDSIHPVGPGGIESWVELISRTLEDR